MMRQIKHLVYWSNNVAKSDAQRRREADARKREQGLTMCKVWIRPEHKHKLKEFEAEHQKEGGKNGS